MENINLCENFNEVYIKSKVDYKMFKNYFHQEINQFAVHNSIQFSSSKYLLSGFGLINLFHDYKINFKEIEDNDSFILLKLNQKHENELDELLEFYVGKNNSGKIKFGNEIDLENVINISSVKKINFESIIIVKSLMRFYDKYSSYFSDVDNYFPMNEVINRIGCSCFFVLSEEKVNKTPSLDQFKFKAEDDFNLGDEIIAVTSSLSVISSPHFSNSFSKGIISNQLTRDILLLDIRVLPNSHGSVVFKKNNRNKNFTPIGMILPVLNVKYSYTPLVYSIRMSTIMGILEEIYSKSFKRQNKKNFTFDKLEIRIGDNLTHLKDTVFIIYNQKNYATCFYLGKGYFITNKHFFDNEMIDDEEIFVKNYKFIISCRKVFIPNNNLDLAIIKIRYYKQEYNEDLVSIKIYKGKVTLLQPIYCVSFSYFDRREIMNELKLPNVNKGVISNKIVTDKNSVSMSGFKANFDFVYGVDCACYSGGSGGPIVDSNGELIGVLFQNLTFQTDKHSLQLPNSAFILSKEIVKELNDVLYLNDDSSVNLQDKLNSLWICKIPNEKMDQYLNFTKFNPKF